MATQNDKLLQLLNFTRPLVDSDPAEGQWLLLSAAVCFTPDDRETFMTLAGEAFNMVEATKADAVAKANGEAPAKYVREFSPCGPCLTIGRLVRETPKFFVYNEWLGGNRFAEGEKRIGKRGTLVHTEPCRSCRDHPDTVHPNGYMD